MTTANKAQYRQNLKRLKTALSGKYTKRKTTQSAYVVGEAHVKIDGRYYDASTSGITGTTTAMVNVGRPAAAIYAPVSGGAGAIIGGGSSTSIVEGGTGAPTDAAYLTTSLNSGLSNERVLAVTSALTLDPGVANGAATLGIATPPTLSATSVSSALTGSHAVTASAAPGAIESLLKAVDGLLTLPTFAATSNVRTPLIDTATDGITIAPADELLTLEGSLSANSSTVTELWLTTAAASAVSTMHFNRARGDIDSPTAAQTGDPLGLITFGGYHDGGGYGTTSAWISAYAAENQTGSARGGDLSVFTTAVGSVSPTEQQRWHSTGNVTIGTSTDSGYKFDVSGTMRATTSLTTPLLTTASNVDLVINPAGTGAVQFPNDQKLRTSDFDSSFPIEGWQINEHAAITGKSVLTIGEIQADELSVRVFVADEVRVDRGDEYWTKSYGIIAENFTTPGSIGGTVSVKFEDSPALVGAIFSNNDWALIRKLEIDSGLTLYSIWGQFSSYVDNADGTQNWTFTLRSGPTSEAITKGSLAIDFGASGAALIHLSVIDATGAPYIKMRRWVTDPYSPSNYTTYVQLGDLGGIGNSYYTPSGDGLYIRSTAAEDKFIVADDNGVQIRGASLTLWDGATQTVAISNTGTDIWVGSGVSNKILSWNGTSLALRASSADVITFDTSGNSYFSGVMTIGTSGEIRQGTGTLGSDYTGLRIWRDTNVGRIAGYNNNAAQWYANTDGKLYAGAGAFMADANGIHIANDASSRGLRLYRQDTFTDTYKVGELWALSDLDPQIYLAAGRSTGAGDDDTADGILSLVAYGTSSDISLVLDTTSLYATMTGLLRTDTLRPTVTDTSDLGTSSFYYNNAYIRNLHVDTVVGTPSYSHSHAASDITSGTLDLARIPATLTGKDADTLDGYHAADFALAGSGGVGDLTQGGGISITGTLANYTISHADTSSASSADNSGGTVVQDLTFDTYGHTTAIVSANLDTRYAQALTQGTGISISGSLSGYTIAHADTSSQTSMSATDGNVIQYIWLDDKGHVTFMDVVDFDNYYMRTVTEGSGISITGTAPNLTISHADTSSVSGASPSGTVFIQSLLFDGYGHVTSVGTADAATALDSRYVNAIGDTIIGDLTLSGAGTAIVFQDGGELWQSAGTAYLLSSVGLSLRSGALHIGGSDVIAIDDTRRFWPADGTAGAPGITRQGDSDTGMYYPGDNQVAFATGGTQVLALGVSSATVTGSLGVSTGLTAATATIGSNTDVNTVAGRAIIGYGAGDTATLSHYDHNTSTNYGWSQSSAGATQINAASGQTVGIGIDDVSTVDISDVRILPRGSTDIHLGDYNRKFGDINATTLAVQLLVARQVTTTVGGQIIVSESNQLIADVSSVGVPGGTDDMFTNMVAYWALDQASGTRLDSKGTNHLTDRNTVTSTTGKIGLAAQFDRANSERLNISDNAALSAGDVLLYAAGFVYPTLDDGNSNTIAAKGGSSGNRAWALAINWGGSSNRFEFTVYSPADAATTVVSAAISVNTWYWVEVWHNPTSNLIGLAVNGTETTAAFSAGIKDDTGNFTLGALSSSNHYTGRIDEFFIIKGYIPDSTRRTWLYNSGNGRSYTDIFNYGAGAFSLDLKYNSSVSGEFLYMFSAPGGVQQEEVFQLTSGPTTITGGFRYDAVRNLNGDGPFDWYVGDALTSLSAVVGGGYINMTATTTINGHEGPATVYYVRSGMGAWDAVAPVVAEGNLRSFVDYTDDQFGHAAGNDLLLTPATGFKGYTIDTINGMRTFNVDITLYEEEVPFLSLGTISGFDIEINDSANNDNRAISFNQSGDARSFIKAYEGVNEHLLNIEALPVTGADTTIYLYAEAATSETASISLYASNASSDASSVSITQTSSPSAATVTLNTGGTINLAADTLISASADLDMNGNDIIDVGAIGDTWTGLSFGSGWTNFGAGFQAGNYKKFGDIVFLRGLVARTSGSGTTIATLPSGYRPSDSLAFVVTADGAYGEIRIASTGVITFQIGSPVYVSLSGIFFSTL